MNRLHRYCGARSLSDLKTIVLDSLPMSSSMVFQPNSTISGLLGVSKLLFVMILAARFWSFCSWLMSVDPAQPQTEQQYRKWGSKLCLKVFIEDACLISAGRLFRKRKTLKIFGGNLPILSSFCEFQPKPPMLKETVCLKENLIQRIWAAHTRIINMLRTSRGSTGQVWRGASILQLAWLHYYYSFIYSFIYLFIVGL